MKHPWSIRAHLFVLVLAVALPLTGLLTYVLIAEAWQEAQEANTEVLNLARLTRANIQEFLTNSETLLASLAKRPLIRAVDPTRCDPLLNEFLELHPEFTSILVTDLSGQMICSTLPQTSGAATPTSTRVEWLQRVIETDRFVVSKPFLAQISGKWRLALAYPIHDDRDILVGVLAVGFDLVGYQRVLNLIPHPQDTIITLIDAEGTVIARSQEPEIWVGHKLPDQEIVNIVLAQDEGQVRAFNLDGVDKIWGLTTLTNSGWHVSASIPSEVVFASVRIAALRSGLWVLAVILLVVALAVYLSQRIERPVRRLAQAIEATGAGQLNTRLSIEGPTEIAEVARQFNAMLIARKQAEESLRIKDMAIASAVTGIIFTDFENKIIYANHAFLEMWGYEHEAEILGRLNTDLVPVAERVPEIVAEIARHGSWAGEIEALKKDGTIFFTQVTTTLVKDETGTPLLTMATCVDVTAHRQAEESLRLKDHAIVSSVAGMIFTDFEGRITYANHAAVLAFGYEHEQEMLGQFSIFGRVPEIIEVVKQNGSWVGEIVTTSKDGTTLVIHENVTLVTDELGHPLSLMATFIDITKRKQAEEALRLKDQAIAAAVTGIAFSDLTGRITYANHAFTDMFGYDREEDILGRPTTDFVSQASHLVQNRQTIHQQGSWAGEMTLVKKDGTIFSVQMSSVLITDETGTPLAIAGTLMDITERKQAEEALRQSEERFRQVITSISEHIYMIEVAADGSNMIHYLSPNLEFLTGYPTQQIIDSPDFWISTVVHPEDQANVVSYLGQVGPGQSGEVEYRLIRADGRISWVRDSVKVEQTGAESKMLYGVISDITHARDMEEQFRQSQKMDAVGQLAGGIAHDFNNLLTVIGGYSELALTRHMRDGPHPLRPNIEQIKKASDRASLLTGQLLAFSRKQMLQPKVLDLNGVVTDIEKMLGRLIGENIEVATLLQPELGLVKVDPGQIEQVIINLAVNARDAMPQGGKLIIETDNVELDETYTSQHVGAKPGAYVLLSFSDSGHGMDAETRSHIFEPFYTTKERGRGTGLGLATVHGIIIQSGGHIWVYSEPGHGTTFKIYLPRLAEAVEPAKQEELPIIFERGSETIVLVEDEDMVRELARRVLSAEGYTVLEARNGQEALQICQEHSGQIDLVITDVIMPGMSGRQLADRLVSLYPTLRVLYISGYTDNALAQQGVLDPDITLLEKPFTAQELARKVREFLNTEIRD